MKKIHIFPVALIALLAGHAGIANETATTQKSVPEPKLCKVLDQEMHRCARSYQDSCNSFAEHFKTMARNQDYEVSGTRLHGPTIVLCKDHRLFVSWVSVGFTRSMAELFASEEYRNSLDGALAEDFRDKSLDAQKKMQK